MKIKSITFTPASTTSEPIFLRPWTMPANEESVQAVYERFGTGNAIAPHAIAPLMFGLMVPAPVVEGAIPVDIPNGWDAKRFRFTMEVEVYSTEWVKIILMICGYTDKQGLLIGYRNGQKDCALDPEMQLYFNSVIYLEEMSYDGEGGKVWKSRAIDSRQVIKREHSLSVIMRPEDVITNASSRDYIGSMPHQMVDLRPLFVHGAIRPSKRSNAQSSSYLSNLLAALKDGASISDLHTDHHAVLAAAMGMVREPVFETCPFFKEMQERTKLFERGFVTWGELCSLDPEVDDIATIVDCPTSPVTLVSEPWDGNDVETTIALLVANSISGHMVDTMFSKIDVYLTNDTFTGDVECHVMQVQSLKRGAQFDLLDVLRGRLKHELFQEILPLSSHQLKIRINSTLGDETMIWLTLNDRDEKVFVHPTFADSLASPVLADNIYQLSKLALTTMYIHRLINDL